MPVAADKCAAMRAVSGAALHMLSTTAPPSHRRAGQPLGPQRKAAEGSPHLEVCIRLILVGAVDACHNIRPRELHLRQCMPDSMRPAALGKRSCHERASAILRYTQVPLPG